MIQQPKAEDEYFFVEGCHILEISNSDEDPLLSIARARVEKGERTRWHALNGARERYLILEGEGMVEVGNRDAQRVRRGDVVFIHDGERQRICNCGEGDLIFLALCTPRFQPEMYRDLEPL
ncbi:MAG: cupin domain-containing protein [Gammaproteobacteria bacterium]|nr:cupin domain-containing protein [Gammaproteobacteria bacterium]